MNVNMRMIELYTILSNIVNEIKENTLPDFKVISFDVMNDDDEIKVIVEFLMYFAQNTTKMIISTKKLSDIEMGKIMDQVMDQVTKDNNVEESLKDHFKKLFEKKNMKG